MLFSTITWIYVSPNSYACQYMKRDHPSLMLLPPSRVNWSFINTWKLIYIIVIAVRPNPIQAICICIVIIWGRWRPWGRVQDFPKFERLHINLLKLHGNLSVIPDGRGYSFHSTWQALITRSFSVGSCSKLLSASSHVDAESSLWSAEFLFFFNFNFGVTMDSWTGRSRSWIL